MKIVLFANSFYPFALIENLIQQHTLAAVISAAEPNPYTSRLEEFAGSKGIIFRQFSAVQLGSTAISWIADLHADLFLVFTFSYKIPNALLQLPALGCYNIHFSLLPKYRGIAPLFWQIKNGDPKGGITVHKMDSGFDTGPIVAQLPVEIFPGESQGLYASRLSALAPAVVSTALDIITGKDGRQSFEPQDQSQSSSYPRPTAKDLAIDWASQSAQQIENLVNASNPACQGAISILRGQMIRILEVSPANLGENVPETTAGTVLFADINQGIFVQCVHGILRINILEMAEGIISGSRLAALGLRATERFESFTHDRNSVTFQA